MGQYYMPVIKRGNTLRRVYSHDFDNGLKLIEHSYIDNNFVNVIANNLVDNPAQLYWVGDYAEEGDFASPAMAKRIYNYAWNRTGRGNTTLEETNEKFNWDDDWYYINMTKMQYIKMPKPGDFVYSPVSLLTAMGNGRGGGDYYGDNPMVGKWAGDKVYLSKTVPEDEYENITAECDFGNNNW